MKVHHVLAVRSSSINRPYLLPCVIKDARRFQDLHDIIGHKKLWLVQPECQHRGLNVFPRTVQSDVVCGLSVLSRIRCSPKLLRLTPILSGSVVKLDVHQSVPSAIDCGAPRYTRTGGINTGTGDVDKLHDAFVSAQRFQIRAD